MVDYIRQQEWNELEHVTTIGVDEVKDFFITRNDKSFLAKPLSKDTRMLKGFLLYYMRKYNEALRTLPARWVMDIEREEFKEYLGSAAYHADTGMNASAPAMRMGYGGNAATNAPPVDQSQMTPQEFRRSVKRDKSHYTDLKDDKQGS